MNHYCTYFDRGFLIQGVALWRSLVRHDASAALWVLALDDFTCEVLREFGEESLRVVPLAEIEAGDSSLVLAKGNRSRVEYYFTLSPCWPNWLLSTHSEIPRVTYLDADLFLFADPQPAFAAMDAAHASVLITAHAFPAWLLHYERHGRFNVGFLSFRNDRVGRACLADWRERCLAWCYDRLEAERYADQKYLDEWPSRWDPGVLVLDDGRVNLAPWNWARWEPRVDAAGAVQTSSGGGLIVFHFARFRPIFEMRWWHSGQLDYGVMPRKLRHAIYGPYWRALSAEREEIAKRRPGFDFPQRSARLGRGFWRMLPLRVCFGGDWLRVGSQFYNLRFGAGRWSGRCLALLRRIFLREKRAADSTSHSKQLAAGK